MKNILFKYSIVISLTQKDKYPKQKYYIQKNILDKGLGGEANAYKNT